MVMMNNKDKIKVFKEFSEEPNVHSTNNPKWRIDYNNNEPSINTILRKKYYKQHKFKPSLEHRRIPETISNKNVKKIFVTPMTLNGNVKKIFITPPPRNLTLVKNLQEHDNDVMTAQQQQTYNNNNNIANRLFFNADNYPQFIPYDNIYNIIYNSESISKYFKEHFVDSIESGLKLGPIIGRGKQATVYQVDQLNFETVIKRVYFNSYFLEENRNYTFDIICQNLGITRDEQRQFHQYNESINQIKIPTTNNNGYLSNDLIFHEPSGGYKAILKMCELNDFNYICSHAFFSEAIISAILSKLKSPHILRTYGFLIRKDSGYLFLERIKETMFEYLKVNFLFPEMLRSFLFQTIVGIYDMQSSESKTIHYDLNLTNIFLSDRCAPTRYEICGEFYEIPYDYRRISVKIGDFGFSASYLNGNLICRQDIYDGEYNEFNITKNYQQSYDLLYLYACFYHYIFKTNNLEQLANSDDNDDEKISCIVILRKMMEQWTLDIARMMNFQWLNGDFFQVQGSKDSPIMSYFCKQVFIDQESLRPKEEYSNCIYPQKILSHSSIFRSYHKNISENK